ncbi:MULTISPECIES: MarR family winged helix-turn-helix transcriptional regulator [unclassified Streptomyces]|uniref:MarR family winged helix-turn-helix transcriptional regulator n=1 Tax=unclassified Streptomyces TaxID=2593676 RepID=UPI001661F494|nr:MULTISPECIES: MarR family transcriptional regulator [unclassified Streptomyces]MBD0842975.1 MarR family transcriptional regulator [Streptomyces sp. TRM68416]
MATADDRQGRAAGEEAGAAPPASDLQSFAVHLRRMNGEINRLVHGFAGEQGLHATDVQALAAILDTEEPMTPKRLREHLGLTSGAVTACLDRLERAGHIRRVRESADRRVVHLYYASDARTAARTYFRPLARATEAARSRFTDDELSVALRFLAAMNDELSALRPTDG